MIRAAPRSAPPGSLLRTARPGDLPACLETWHTSTDDHGRNVGRPPQPRSFGQLQLLLEHALATDPDRFWVAVRAAPAAGERVVGFASAVVRGGVWFLAMLFVLPDDQAQGLGTALLERVLPDPGDGLVLATCTDATQSISNAMYARLGIVPRVPVLQLVGRPDRAPLPGLPPAVRAVPFKLLERAAGGAEPPAADGLPRAGSLTVEHLAGALDAVDRRILGYARPTEHAFLGRTGRHGYLYETTAGQVLGYGYVAESGRLGPVALDDPGLAGPVLGHLVAAVEPPGAYLAWVPGSFDRAIVALLQAGFRLEDFPALVCWNRPFGRLDRYLPLSLAIL